MCDKCDKGRLDRIELRLKRIAVVGALLGLVLTTLNILQAWQQRRLSQAQEVQTNLVADEARERRRVNLDVDLKTSEAAPDKGLTVFLTATNNSSQSVDIAMVGVLIWKNTWKSGDILREKPEKVIYVDNVVAGCPADVCPRETPRSILRSGYPETVSPGASMADGFGPYPIAREELRRGVWIQAFVLPVEQDDESKCVFVGPLTLERGYPVFCEEARKDVKDCDNDTECLFFNAVPLYYQSGRK